jgi:MFS family permease
VIEGQVPATEHAAGTEATGEEAVSRRSWAPFIAGLMLAYFGASVALFAPVENVLPRLIESAGGSAHKAVYLGLVTGLGAVAALVFNPLAGYFSDRRVTADNRWPVVAIGLAAGTASLALLGVQRSVIGIAICWTLCQATINIAYSSMAASVIDHVPRKDWGFAWGLLAVSQALGIILGFGAIVLVFPSEAGGMTAIAVIYAVCLVPLVLILRRLPRVQLDGPGRYVRDGLKALVNGGTGYTAVWIGQFLMELANSIALLYLYYYLQDVIHYANPSRGQLILVGVATAATILATVAVGRLADRSVGYRRYAMLATTLLAATGFTLAVINSWDPVIACAFALGAGYGAYQSVSSALSLTVLPDRASAARDLGIINIASSIPQVIGPSVAALVVTSGVGYRGLFAFAGLLALGAGVAFSRVPANPPQTPAPDAPPSA